MTEYTHTGWIPAFLATYKGDKKQFLCLGNPTSWNQSYRNKSTNMKIYWEVCYSKTTTLWYIYTAVPISCSNKILCSNKNVRHEVRILTEKVIPHTKIKPKHIKDLNIKPKSIEILEENRGGKLYNIGFDNDFLDMRPKAQKIIETTDKLDYSCPWVGRSLWGTGSGTLCGYQNTWMLKSLI